MPRKKLCKMLQFDSKSTSYRDKFKSVKEKAKYNLRFWDSDESPNHVHECKFINCEEGLKIAI